jgi:hypothetical protein
MTSTHQDQAAGADAGRRPPRRKLHRAALDFRTRFASRRSRGELANSENERYRAGTPAEVTSVRAKSSRHGKSTADKWNQ